MTKTQKNKFAVPHLGKELTVTAKFADTVQSTTRGYEGDCTNIFSVRIQYDGKSTSFKFHDSIHNWRIGIVGLDESALASALDCFVLDAMCGNETFEDFCSDMDCDTDSRKALKIWQDCGKATAAAKRLGIDLSELYDTLNP